MSIELLPLGKRLRVERGAPLQELLFAEGVEFPCGGKGRCKGCKIKVLSGSLPITEEDAQCLSKGDLAEGWRLACRAVATGNLAIDLAQWESPILADDSHFEFRPRAGLGVAVDVGTTTLVAQLIDLRNGHVLAVRTALNAQAQYGADIMSRVEFALKEGGLARLSGLIREQVGGLIRELLESAPRELTSLNDVVVVGNTVMHHLFCGLDLASLAHYPFVTQQPGLQLFSAEQLDWDSLLEKAYGLRRQSRASPAAPQVRFLPCLGGFVGSDILAGVLATRLHESESLAALIDLGTNGEIVVGNKERLLCASTAAGPAFEGARISMGMRAATGAISEVVLNQGRLECHVLGHVPPRGICGSGLVDAVAAGLELGWINPAGRLTNGSSFVLAPPVQITQADIRELQLAKAAIAAGLRILLQKWGAQPANLSRIYLAGAFGNYINRTSAERIGLIHFPSEKVLPSGNTALLGAKLVLANLPLKESSPPEFAIEHVALNENPEFHEIYVDEMGFRTG